MSLIDDDVDRDPLSLGNRIIEILMVWAVRRGDAEFISDLTATRTDLNARLKPTCLKVKGRHIYLHGVTKRTNYLIEAVRSRQAGSVQALLSGGADINMRRNTGMSMSPLHVASMEGFTDIVRILLDNGADIESRNIFGLTPLLIAAMEGHIDVVRLLIGNCTGVNIQLNDEPSVITADSSTAQLDTKSLGLHAYRGADVEAEDCDGQRPIHYAVGLETGRFELVELLIQHGANVDAADTRGNRPLHKAVYHGVDVVQLLVQHGAKLNVQNNDGETPLHIAVQRQRPEVIMFLLSQDADVGLADAFRNTPLHYFTSELSEMIRDKGFGEYLTKLLITKHQHMLVRNVFGVSAITHAAHETTLRNAVYVRSEESLFKALAYVDCNGNTPLHYAVKLYGLKSKTFTYHYGAKVAEFLLEHGADINAQNNEGLTPLHVALMAGDKEAIWTCLQYANDQSFRIIDKRGRNFWHLLFLFASDNINNMREVAEHVCDVSSVHNVDDLKRTPLHYACLTGVALVSWKLVSTMIDEHIDMQDKFGRTALHYAAMSNNERILESLVTKLNDTQIQDVFGYRYIDYAIMRQNLELTELAMMSLSDCYNMNEYWVRKTFSAKFNDLVQYATHQLRKIISKLRDCSDSTSHVQNIYLECRLDYSKILRSQEMLFIKESVYRRKGTKTKTRSTDMFAAIENRVRKAMEYLVSEISARDSRFACKVIAVGSAYEGTKIGLCDEFDYCFVLTNLSRMCKVCYSPESPPGFVLLKASTSEYDEDLFNCNGTLDAVAVKFKFETLVKEVASSLGFCEVTGFEPLGLGRVQRHWLNKLNHDLIAGKPHTCIKVVLTQPVDGIHVLHEISVDIVPALQINDWWPDDARRKDLCQTGDCLIVFSQPQKRYPWVGWTEPQGFISFARAESRLLRESPQVVKAAYMVVKRMSASFKHDCLSSHVIKTALLWCLDEEGFRKCSSSDDSDAVNGDELSRLVQNILRRLLCFAAQDYVPCYFMPKCHQPVCLGEIYLRQFHIHLYQHGLTYKDLFNFSAEQLSDKKLDEICRTFVYSHLMYWSVLSDTDELNLFVSSTINPLREIGYESDTQS